MGVCAFSQGLYLSAVYGSYDVPLLSCWKVLSCSQHRASLKVNMARRMHFLLLMGLS